MKRDTGSLDYGSYRGTIGSRVQGMHVYRYISSVMGCIGMSDFSRPGPPSIPKWVCWKNVGVRSR